MGNCSLGRALKCLFDLTREAKADKVTKEVAAANKQSNTCFGLSSVLVNLAGLGICSSSGNISQR